MMRLISIINIIILIICSSKSFAQINIDSTDLIEIGDQVTMYNDTTTTIISPGSNGSDQSWDFSNLLKDDTRIFNIIEPASVSGGSLFPEANLAVASESDTSFILKTQNKLEIYGLIQSDIGNGEPGAIKYINPSTIFKLPFTYQDKFIDTASFAILVSGDDIDAGTLLDSLKLLSTPYSSTIVDGYGTLITPTATFENCLRLKTFTIRYDSIWTKPIGSTEWKEGFDPFIEFVQIDSTISFTWVAKNQKFSILDIEYNAETNEVNSIEFNANKLTSTPSDIISESRIMLYPNPASEVLNILSDQSFDHPIIQIFDIQGKHVRKFKIDNISNNIELPISDLKNGDYSISIKNNNKVLYSSKFIKQ